MKRSLLGIIIVVSLQLGFTTYNAIDRPIESLFAVNEITTGTNPVASSLDNSDGAAFLNVDANRSARGTNSGEIVSTLNRRKAIPPAAAILLSSKKAVRIPTAKSVPGMPQFVAMQKPWDSITIPYPGAMLAGGESENYQLSARVASRPEKKSFVSKSVSVLKKPYDWLKALGSRIIKPIPHQPLPN